MDILQAIPWLSIHIIVVTLTLLAVVIADWHGLLWLSGRLQTVPERRMRLLHTFVWIGLIVTMIAGFMVFAGYPDYLLSLWTFRFKLLFVLILVLNAFLIGKHLPIAIKMPYRDVPIAHKRRLLASGIISSLSWLAAYTLAHFLE